MKKSGLTFDTIPKNWQVVPIKAVAQYSVSNVDKHSIDDQEPVRLCNYTDVYKNESITLDMDLMKATATLEEISKFHLEVDDVVITKDSESWNDIAIPAYIAETSDDLVCGYHLAIIRPKKQKLNGRFLFRCLQSRPVALQLELASTGVTRYGLPKGAIGSAIIPLPSVNIQKQIADSLDRETTQIDNLIAAKEQMLTLLEEKRKALISRSTTHEIRTSNLTEWKSYKLKFIAPLKTERRDQDTQILEYLGLENIESWTGKHILNSTNSENDDLQMTGVFFSSSNVLFGKLRPYLAKVFLPESSGICSTEFLVLEPIDKVRRKFLFYVLINQEFIASVNSSTFGSRMPRANWDFIGSQNILIPSLEQQDNIVNYLDCEIAKNDELLAAIKDSIALLKERRSALITAAVTGQINIQEMSKHSQNEVCQ